MCLINSTVYDCTLEDQEGWVNSVALYGNRFTSSLNTHKLSAWNIL